MNRRTLLIAILTMAFFSQSLGGMAMAAELQIEIITEGTGDSAEMGQQVSVHYEGKLTDGTVFDASRPRGAPFSFTLGAGQVIQGWEEGVTGMKIGEVRKLIIPPELGYGLRGAGGVIPPNATLEFEVELMAISTPATLGQASIDDLKQAQENGVIIIDIRREDEWIETGIIEGAEAITAFTQTGQLHPEFQEKFMAAVEGADTPIMLVCRSGNRTSNLGNALIEQLGFTDVSHLEGGMLHWLGKGQKTIPFTTE